MKCIKCKCDILANKNSFKNSLDKKCLLYLKLIFSNIKKYTQLRLPVLELLDSTVMISGEINIMTVAFTLDR